MGKEQDDSQSDQEVTLTEDAQLEAFIKSELTGYQRGQKQLTVAETDGFVTILKVVLPPATLTELKAAADELEKTQVPPPVRPYAEILDEEYSKRRTVLPGQQAPKETEIGAIINLKILLAIDKASLQFPQSAYIGYCGRVVKNHARTFKGRNVENITSKLL